MMLIELQNVRPEHFLVLLQKIFIGNLLITVLAKESQDILLFRARGILLFPDTIFIYMHY